MIEGVVFMKTIYGNVCIGNHGYYVVTTQNKCHNKLLHRIIFEEFYGKIPKKCVIHHKDGNKLNNCIMNLQLKTHSNHTKEHSSELKHSYENRKKMSKIKFGKPNSTNTSGYYRVCKEKGNQYAQGFTWTYAIGSSRLNDDGKIRTVKKIRRTNLKKLEQAVKDAGYEWRKLSE